MQESARDRIRTGCATSLDGLDLRSGLLDRRVETMDPDWAGKPRGQAVEAVAYLSAEEVSEVFLPAQLDREGIVQQLGAVGRRRCRQTSRAWA